MSTMRAPHRVSIALLASVVALLAGCTAQEPQVVTHPVVPPDEEAKVAAAQADLARDRLLELYPDIEVPEASLVRYVTPEELPTARADCLNAEGFDVTVDDSGGMGWVVTEDFDQEKFYAVQYVCEIKYPLDPKFGEW